MVLMNYIRLEPGVPTRLHFTDWYSMDRDILVKETGGTKRIHSEVFQVDEENGHEVSKTLSVMSQKLWAIFEPYSKDKQYIPYDFIITKMGDGFYTDWNVQVIRRPEEV